jgi:phospholipid-binding lipoprotein MlaA
MLNNPGVSCIRGRALSLLAAVTLVAANSAFAAGDPRDPYEKFNRYVFEFNQTLDDYLLRPVASTYRELTPELIDQAVTNFFTNLRDVPTLANELLQLKHMDAARTATRLMFNTTYGLLGLIDVGAAFDLPAGREDFGQTLNVYGVPQGPYLMLPFLGPATASAAVGFVADTQVDPLFAFGDKINYGLTAVKMVDIRADVIPAENLIVGDRYIFVRNAYLQAREFAISDGKVENDPFLDEDLDEY